MFWTEQPGVLQVVPSQRMQLHSGRVGIHWGRETSHRSEEKHNDTNYPRPHIERLLSRSSWNETMCAKCSRLSMLPDLRTLYKYIILCLSFRCLLSYLTFPLLPISIIAWRWIWICLNFIESDHLTHSDCTIDYRRVDLQINIILGCCLVRSTGDLDANYTHIPPIHLWPLQTLILLVCLLRCRGWKKYALTTCHPHHFRGSRLLHFIRLEAFLYLWTSHTGKMTYKNDDNWC